MKVSENRIMIWVHHGKDRGIGRLVFVTVGVERGAE